MHNDVDRAAKCARRYRDLGLSPLPSRTDRKQPAMTSYAAHRTEPIPDATFGDWGTPNIQLMCGVGTYGPTKILVVDCDGELALGRWRDIARGREPDPTWEVLTGGGGRHFYYQIPEGTPSVPSGPVWGLWDTWGEAGKGGWAKHQEVRILGDTSLAVAPPSVHVTTGRRYAFFGGSPVETPVPALAPAWLLDLPRLAAPTFNRPSPAAPLLKPLIRPSGRFYDRNEVLGAVADKTALAGSWGLRFARTGPNHAGWLSCFAVGREDRTPSGSFDTQTGAYHDCSDRKTYSLFDLGTMLGRFSNWQECRDWCGDQFCPGSGTGTPYVRALRASGARAPSHTQAHPCARPDTPPGAGAGPGAHAN